MRIEYDTTLEKIADAHLRAYVRCNIAKCTRWQSTLCVAALAVVLFFLLFNLIGATLPEIIVFTILGASVTTCVYGLDYYRSMKRRILKYLREQIQSDDAIRFEVELRDDCIWTKQCGTQLCFDWANVVEIVDPGDAVELRMRNGGFVIVRNKGFPTTESRQEFIKIANNKSHAILNGSDGAATQNT